MRAANACGDDVTWNNTCVLCGWLGALLGGRRAGAPPHQLSVAIITPSAVPTSSIMHSNGPCTGSPETSPASTTTAAHPCPPMRLLISMMSFSKCSAAFSPLLPLAPSHHPSSAPSPSPTPFPTPPFSSPHTALPRTISCTPPLPPLPHPKSIPPASPPGEYPAPPIPHNHDGSS